MAGSFYIQGPVSKKDLRLKRDGFGFKWNLLYPGAQRHTLGHNVRIGPGVGLISANHDLDDYDRWPESEPITIGNNVWIGMNSIALPGVTIGDNVAVRANSVLSKDIPSNSIAAGNPCKNIHRKRLQPDLNPLKIYSLH